MDFSTINITSKKVRGNNVEFSTIEITLKKVRKNNADFSTIEVTSKKVRGNNVEFSTIEITSKKVRGNDADFSISEIKSKRYVEMTWKFIEIWSSMYRCNIHVKSMSIRRRVPVGKKMKLTLCITKYLIVKTTTAVRLKTSHIFTRVMCNKTHAAFLRNC